LRPAAMAHLPMIVEFRWMSTCFSRFAMALAATSALLAGPAAAAVLAAPAEAPWFAHVGTDALLVLHIGGGSIGIIAGALAFAVPKGGTLHRRIGFAFVAAMVACYLVGGLVAPFLQDGQRVNATAAALALYLVASGWATARRRAFVAGGWEIAGLCVALSIVSLGFAFIAIARASGEGTIDGSPPQSFVLFTIVGALAAAGEAHALFRRRLVGADRIARHLWRMGLSFFIAAGSFFFGQEQFLPAAIRGTPVQLALGFGPLVATLAWLAWTHRPRGLRARFAVQGR